MKVIKIKCPHCTKTFDLAPLLSGEVRASLIQEFGLTSPACTVKDRAVEDLAEAHRLRELEYEKHLSELRATILDLHRKAAASSQQRAGETFEAEIFQQLKAEFKADAITRVGKGRNGADIVHEVRDERGRTGGRILWELKNTSSWSPKWLGKVRDDAVRCAAQLSVIVATSLPRCITNFGQIEGIWVTNRNSHLGLALALRTQLLACAQLRSQLSDSARLTELSNYITSPGFQEHVTMIASAVTALQIQVDREKQFFERHWAERKKLADTISQNISVLAGGVDGIVEGVAECIQQGNPPVARKAGCVEDGTFIDRV